MPFKKGNQARKGCVPWNKNKKGIHLSPKSEFKKGHTPWCKGTKGIITPWNKDKKGIFSKETLERMSLAAKGRKHSEETKRKMSESKKGFIPWNTGKKCPQFTGKNNPNWGGEKHKHSAGYIFIYAPNHPFAIHGRYVFEHRLVMEKHLGRYLTRKEVVHHRGIKYPIGSIENKQDNRIENLRLFANESEHTTFHNLNR